MINYIRYAGFMHHAWAATEKHLTSFYAAARSAVRHENFVRRFLILMTVPKAIQALIMMKPDSVVLYQSVQVYCLH